MSQTLDRMSTLDVTADYDTKISVRSRHVRSIFVDR